MKCPNCQSIGRELFKVLEGKQAACTSCGISGTVKPRFLLTILGSAFVASVIGGGMLMLGVADTPFFGPLSMTELAGVTSRIIASLFFVNKREFIPDELNQK